MSSQANALVSQMASVGALTCVHVASNPIPITYKIASLSDRASDQKMVGD